MLAKITSKNQLTLPKSVTQAVGPAEYFDVQTRDGQIVLNCFSYHLTPGAWMFEAAAFAAAAPAEEALVIDISDEHHQGTALGFFTAAAGLGGLKRGCRRRDLDGSIHALSVSDAGGIGAVKHIAAACRVEHLNLVGGEVARLASVL